MGHTQLLFRLASSLEFAPHLEAGVHEHGNRREQRRLDEIAGNRAAALRRRALVGDILPGGGRQRIAFPAQVGDGGQLTLRHHQLLRRRLATLTASGHDLIGERDDVVDTGNERLAASLLVVVVGQHRLLQPVDLVGNLTADRDVAAQHLLTTGDHETARGCVEVAGEQEQLRRRRGEPLSARQRPDLADRLGIAHVDGKPERDKADERRRLGSR